MCEGESDGREWLESAEGVDMGDAVVAYWDTESVLDDVAQVVTFGAYADDGTVTGLIETGLRRMGRGLLA